MRRLANQSRDDVYNSQRDYQTIHSGQGVRFRSLGGAHGRITLARRTGAPLQPLAGVGGYIAPSAHAEIYLSLDSGGAEATRGFQLSPVYSRVGLAMEHQGAPWLVVTVTWEGARWIDLWGLNADALDLPPAVAERASLRDLNSKALAPETFYLDHEGPLLLDVVEDESSNLAVEDGGLVSLKKCAYCGRMLPLDMERQGALSFHKHSAKKTLHQNECRSCKKWRINDGLNHLRTPDQFHESSLLNRERRILLREPQILQEIKDRTGDGLKSQVWKRFDRRCFNCERPLELREVQLDHTRPLAYLWPIDEHATCLCADCNNAKKDRFPVDFYNQHQLHRLAGITGLPYEQLVIKAVNPDQLDRILQDISAFARESDPRTFNATARRVKMLDPRVDLYEVLRRADPAAFDDLNQQLRTRPSSVI
ncbi:hypothetical protein TPA0908_06950 [Micromonospora sp. AKA38]|nr:hypothetical protein TPA0908_06950 [Micromonospora sp. AKA38]